MTDETTHDETVLDVTNLTDVRGAREFCAKALSMSDEELADALAADERIFGDLAPFMDRNTRPRVCRVMCQAIRAADLDPSEPLGLAGKGVVFGFQLRLVT